MNVVILALPVVLGTARADPRADMADRVMATLAPDRPALEAPAGQLEPSTDGGAPLVVDLDLPPRTIGFSSQTLDGLSRVDPVGTGLRLAPGVLRARGGLYLQGTPAGDRTVRLDGIELLAP